MNTPEAHFLHLFRNAPRGVFFSRRLNMPRMFVFRFAVVMHITVFCLFSDLLWSCVSGGVLFQVCWGLYLSRRRTSASVCAKRRPPGPMYVQPSMCACRRREEGGEGGGKRAAAAAAAAVAVSAVRNKRTHGRRFAISEARDASHPRPATEASARCRAKGGATRAWRATPSRQAPQDQTARCAAPRRSRV